MLFHFHRSVMMIGLLTVRLHSVQSETIQRSHTHTQGPLLCLHLRSVCAAADGGHQLYFCSTSNASPFHSLFVFGECYSTELSRLMVPRILYMHMRRLSSLQPGSFFFVIECGHTHSEREEESSACSPYLLFDMGAVCIKLRLVLGEGILLYKRVTS